MTAQSFLLPFPPSVNNLFHNVGRKRVLTKNYRQWRDRAGWMLLQQHAQKQAGQVAIEIDLVPQTRHLRDADNCCKAILDILVIMQIIDADDYSTVRKLLVTWHDAGEPCVVTVRPHA